MGAHRQQKPRGLVQNLWPRLARELHEALVAEGEPDLAAQVAQLSVESMCECRERGCHSFYTAPRPEGAYGPGHRNVALTPKAPWMLILDVVDDRIMYVEVLGRSPLD